MPWPGARSRPGRTELRLAGAARRPGGRPGARVGAGGDPLVVGSPGEPPPPGGNPPSGPEERALHARVLRRGPGRLAGGAAGGGAHLPPRRPPGGPAGSGPWRPSRRMAVLPPASRAVRGLPHGPRRAEAALRAAPAPGTSLLRRLPGLQGRAPEGAQDLRQPLRGRPPLSGEPGPGEAAPRLRGPGVQHRPPTGVGAERGGRRQPPERRRAGQPEPLPGRTRHGPR